jgi:mannose-6-phosphate isomerase class I
MYDKHPSIAVGDSSECSAGWNAIAARLQSALTSRAQTLCVECYPGVFTSETRDALFERMQPACVIETASLLHAPDVIEAMLAGSLTDDPVFGVMNSIAIEDFFDPQKLADAKVIVTNHRAGLLLVIGIGAALLCEWPTLLVYADLARWEIQMRQRRNEIANIGMVNRHESNATQYKRAFFVDWRAADRLKRELFPRIDFLLDTNVPPIPKLISGNAFRAALQHCVTRPFRVVPFFDPGPWGGHWMEKVCDLPTEGVPNYAWCFDCVPEENSLLLGFGDARVEIPSIDLVFAHPHALLGPKVYERFGAEFPIRFDFLDTVGGGNLSLQVHPLTEFIRQHFGMDYTQDESYYMLDAQKGAQVYLGLREGIDPEAMIADLEKAQEGGVDFPAEKYVKQFPAKKHDHFLIPAGTVHCSGAGSMVLEISATPYIFTFKLWDWGRLGLDGRPRPIHLKFGEANIQWNRTKNWVKNSLINRFEPLGSGPGWREERTGLHKLEFIETRRHWFTGTVPHNTNGGVHVVNLVEGEEAIVESPNGAFASFIVHYVETFIVPAQVGEYTVRPHGPSIGKECATLQASVRTST